MEPLTDDRPSGGADDTVEREAVLDADPEVVWDALTDAELLGQWLGADVELDVRPAGTGRVVDHDGTVREVLVTRVDPQHALAWHWWDDRGRLSSVEITLEPLDDVTRIRVIEIATPEPGTRLTARASGARCTAWTGTLVALRAVVAAGRLVAR